MFSIIFFAIILFLCIRQSAVVDIVGAVLTPLLLIGLAVIIIKGVATPLGEIALTPNADNVILGGIKAGYQTMDALAALPFGIIILQSAASKGYTTNGQKFEDRLRLGYPRRRAAARRLHGPVLPRRYRFDSVRP